MNQDDTMNQSPADPWAGRSIPPFSRRSFLELAATGAVFCMTGCPTQTGRSPKAGAGTKSFRLDLGVCRSFGDAAIAKRSGLDYIEDGVQRFLVPDKPEADFQEILKAAGKADLPVRACNGFLPASLRLTGPQTRHEEASAFAEKAIRRAGSSGIRILVLGSGGARKVPDGFDRDQAREQFIRFCRGLGPVARRHGVTIVLEPLNRNETNLLNSVAEGVDYVDAIGHPNVQLLADLYHMLLESEGSESLLLAGTRLRHCHIAEKRGRTPPGVDGDDFRPYFRALRQVGYRGGLSFECRWTDFETELTRACRVMMDQWASL